VVHLTSRNTIKWVLITGAFVAIIAIWLAVGGADRLDFMGGERGWEFG
jgi:hypothetical protein